MKNNMGYTIALVVAYALTIPLANWMIGNVGACMENGPCLLPVGFGYMAPSGVAVIGLALVLRDAVQYYGGIATALVAIAIGAVLSFFFAPPALVIASVVAYVLAELADLAVYTPLKEKRLALAVLASGVVGALIDSAIFLWLAFGSLAFIEGQWIGKIWASLLGFAIIAGYRYFKTKDAELERFGVE